MTRPLRLLAPLFLVPLLCFGAAAGAAEEEFPPFDPKKVTARDMGSGIISPYDKFIALQQALKGKKISWVQQFNQLNVEVPAGAEESVVLPTLLGMRISDGVMAIQARDAERLNRCAAEIERAAKVLKVKDESLSRARQVRTAANAGEWLKVFMELGYLQKDVMASVDTEGNRVKGALVIAGGWLQGLRYASTLVRDNYSPETSNYLREPLLVKELLKSLDDLPERERTHPLTVKMRAAMQEIYDIVNIPLDGQISLERVKRIREVADEIVALARAK